MMESFGSRLKFFVYFLHLCLKWQFWITNNSDGFSQPCWFDNYRVSPNHLKYGSVSGIYISIGVAQCTNYSLIAIQLNS